MAGLKIFVSSTCYDLSVVRSQLRMFIQNVGHEPIMSDYNDILYDHRVHTHTSCIDEVGSCDVVVLIVGSRFGGKSVPEALEEVDFEKLIKESNSVESLKNKENLSITQLEVLKAIEKGLPIFAFIDDDVWHDHALYEKNKKKSIVSKIEFPSIQKKETAKYIFEFINFLRHRTRGNSVFAFSKLQDIEETLRKQWSQLFQKLLLEDRSRLHSAKRFDDLTDQFENLKTAILTSIGGSNEKLVASSVVRFRKLVSFIKGLKINQFDPKAHEGTTTFDSLLAQAGILNIYPADKFPSELFQTFPDGRSRVSAVLVKKDKTFFELRNVPPDYLNDMAVEWSAWSNLDPDTRVIVWDALEAMTAPSGYLRYEQRDIFEYAALVSAKAAALKMFQDYKIRDTDQPKIDEA